MSPSGLKPRTPPGGIAFAEPLGHLLAGVRASNWQISKFGGLGGRGETETRLPKPTASRIDSLNNWINGIVSGEEPGFTKAGVGSGVRGVGRGVSGAVVHLQFFSADDMHPFSDEPQ